MRNLESDIGILVRSTGPITLRVRSGWADFWQAWRRGGGCRLDGPRVTLGTLDTLDAPGERYEEAQLKSWELVIWA
jgi:hypothetical protein